MQLESGIETVLPANCLNQDKNSISILERKSAEIPNNPNLSAKETEENITTGFKQHAVENSEVIFFGNNSLLEPGPCFSIFENASTPEARDTCFESKQSDFSDKQINCLSVSVGNADEWNLTS